MAIRLTLVVVMKNCVSGVERMNRFKAKCIGIEIKALQDKDKEVKDGKYK